MKREFLTIALAGLFCEAAFASAAVYDVTLTVKTTKAERGNVKAFANMCGETGKILYRKQATVKLQGLLWGCGCERLTEPPQFSGWYEDGFAFWNAAERKAYSAESEFAWRMLNRIGSTAKEVEGCWDMRLADGAGETVFDLVGAGFGTVKDTILSKDKESGTVEIDYDESYVASISGSFAGTGIGPAITTVTVIEEECSYCTGGRAREEIVEREPSTVWSLCACGGEDDALTAAHGTWTIKYNASASKRLAKSSGILEAANVPKYVKSAL